MKYICLSTVKYYHSITSSKTFTTSLLSFHSYASSHYQHKKNLHKNLFSTYFLHILNKKYYVYYLSDTKVSFFLRSGSHHCLFSQEPCSDNGPLIGPCLSLQFYFMSPLITIFQHHFTFSQHL